MTYNIIWPTTSRQLFRNDNFYYEFPFDVCKETQKQKKKKNNDFNDKLKELRFKYGARKHVNTYNVLLLD